MTKTTKGLKRLVIKEKKSDTLRDRNLDQKAQDFFTRLRINFDVISLAPKKEWLKVIRRSLND